jgi:hypothetical protein
MKHQTIWVVELQPVWPNGAGGFDWYYRYDDAYKQFANDKEGAISDGNQIGLYAVQLPIDWTHEQIEAWTELNCDVLPRYEDTIAPATAVES